MDTNYPNMVHPNFPLSEERIKKLLGTQAQNVLIKRVNDTTIVLQSLKGQLQFAQILLERTGEFDFSWQDYDIPGIPTLYVIATLRGATNMPADESVEDAIVAISFCDECKLPFDGTMPGQRICVYCNCCITHCTCSLLSREEQFGDAGIPTPDTTACANALAAAIFQATPYYYERIKMLDAIIGLREFATKDAHFLNTITYALESITTEMSKVEEQLECEYPKHS